MKYFNLLLSIILYYILTFNVLALEKNIDNQMPNNSIVEGNLSNSVQNSSTVKEINNNLLKFNSDMKKLEGSISTLKRYTEENKEDVANLKSLIEENSIRLYKMLIKVDDYVYTSENSRDKIDNSIKNFISENEKYKNEVEIIKKAQLIELEISKHTDRLWFIFSMLLVFLIPFAFYLSHNKKSNSSSTDIFIIWVITLITYSLYVFFIENILFIWLDSTDIVLFNINDFLYQLTCISITTLLFFKILEKQFTLAQHVIITFFIAALLYPLLSYWLNIGGIYYLDSFKLQKITDLTNITLIYMFPAWIALMFLFIGKKTLLINNDLKYTTMLYSVISTLIFFFIWISLYNFKLTKDSYFIYSILNMGLAAISGAFSLLMIQKLFFKNYSSSIIIGAFSGLIAIAASGYLVSPIEAIIIGSIASMIQILAYQLLKIVCLPYTKQSNILILISIHGFTSIWGILSIPIFIKQDLFLTQMMGIVAVIALSFLSVIFYLLIANIFNKLYFIIKGSM